MEALRLRPCYLQQLVGTNDDVDSAALQVSDDVVALSTRTKAIQALGP